MDEYEKRKRERQEAFQKIDTELKDQMLESKKAEKELEIKKNADKIEMSKSILENTKVELKKDAREQKDDIQKRLLARKKKRAQNASVLLAPEGMGHRKNIQSVAIPFGGNLKAEQDQDELQGLLAKFQNLGNQEMDVMVMEEEDDPSTLPSSSFPPQGWANQNQPQNYSQSVLAPVGQKSGLDNLLPQSNQEAQEET